MTLDVPGVTSTGVTEMVTDVAVCGTGAAGLAAALSAARHGAHVLLLERTPLVGGTTATSSGLVYAPGSTKMDERGVAEDLDSAVEYLAGVARSGFDRTRARVFVTSAREVIADLEQAGVPFRPTGLADFYPDKAGASVSRPIAPQPFAAAMLGEWQDRVRRSPYRALESGDTWTGGTALTGALLRACLNAGVEIWTQARAIGLRLADGEVRGVSVIRAGGRTEVHARGGVVLATGGYEYSRDLLDRFLPQIEGAWSSPANEGDGLVLAESAHAALGSMDSAQWYALVRIREENREGTPRFDDCAPARCLPGSMMMDQTGRRFVNEGTNFNDVGRAVADNPAKPAWLVIDSRFTQRYGERCFGDAGPGTARWTSADSPRDLANGLGIDPVVFEQTLRQFNADAANLVDTMFGRGSTAFDRSWGDSEQPGAAACLAPLATAPLHTTRVYAGLSGTSGGPRTDGSGRVLRQDGKPVPGLWAAGNAMASFLGDGCPGSGATLGPALVFGALAGHDAAARVRAA
jgi:3-oxosteroid 1-dehydrogenase